MVGNIIERDAGLMIRMIEEVLKEAWIQARHGKGNANKFCFRLDFLHRSYDRVV